MKSKEDNDKYNNVLGSDFIRTNFVFHFPSSLLCNKVETFKKLRLQNIISCLPFFPLVFGVCVFPFFATTP